MNVTVYIVVSIIAFIAAILSGTAVVGGAALMTIILTFFLGGELAVPILTIIMLIANLTRAFSGFKEIDWKKVCLFLITAFPLSLLGALGFTFLPQNAVNIILGIAIIIFSVLKYVRLNKITLGKKSILGIGFVSGFLSGFVGSSGPISAIFFFFFFH